MHTSLNTTQLHRTTGMELSRTPNSSKRDTNDLIIISKLVNVFEAILLKLI
jgi:hypothetical protein